MPNPPPAVAPPVPETHGVLDDPETHGVLDDPETHGVRDELSPEVVPRFLRRQPAAVPAPEKTEAVVPVDATLIDTITRIVTEMMETHVRESVTAAVRALAPRLVVSLPPDGVDGSPQVRSRPTRRAKRVD